VYPNGEGEPKEEAMSTRVGTLQGTSAGPSIWPAAVLASLVMLTIAVTAISIDGDEGRQGGQTVVGRHVVNTPSELSGGIPQTVVGGTANNTPTELSGGIVGGFPETFVGGTANNTPSELTGGDFERYGRHQRI